jgi:2-oxoglutarate dehydrogenase E2 component (dihydrolipoamide succinyltransferase)
MADATDTTVSLVVTDGARVMADSVILEAGDTFETGTASARTLVAQGDAEYASSKDQKAAEADAPKKPASQQAAEDAAGEDDLSSKNVEELEAIAEERGITVEGTGKDGNVLKGDLLSALSD